MCAYLPCLCEYTKHSATTLRQVLLSCKVQVLEQMCVKSQGDCAASGTGWSGCCDSKSSCGYPQAAGVEAAVVKKHRKHSDTNTKHPVIDSGAEDRRYLAAPERHKVIMLTNVGLCLKHRYHCQVSTFVCTSHNSRCLRSGSCRAGCQDVMNSLAICS